MPCAAPISAWRPALGGPLVFKPPTNGRAYTPIQVPCGYCILCREEQARQTAVRITHEAKDWIENSFITLTYDDQHLPKHGSLDYSDLQKFWKRLRKHIGTLRYYAVGEYGDKTKRPHYHACIFGHAFIEDRVITQTEPYLLWENKRLSDIWGNGRVTIGALTFETARYTASYVTKKLKSKQRYVRLDEDTGELVAVVQPRAFMSRNIGKNWWVTWGHQLKDHDRVIINGIAQKPPKAYDKWLAESEPEKLEEIKEKRKNLALQTAAQTEDDNRARARNAHARVERKHKTI